jgi:hypothetical protein
MGTVTRGLAALQKQGIITIASPKTIIIEDIEMMCRATPVAGALINLLRFQTLEGWGWDAFEESASPAGGRIARLQA